MSDYGLISGTHVPAYTLPVDSHEGGLAGPSWWGRLYAKARPPADIQGYTLTGTRRPGPIRIVIAHDVSGSMTAFAPARERALEHFFAWAPQNLRSHDEIAVLDFAGRAAWRLQPTTIQRLAENRYALHPATGVDAGGTELGPVLHLVAALPPTTARTSVWLFSDAQFSDYPPNDTTAHHDLHEAGIATMPLLVPDPAITVPPTWWQCYPHQITETFNGHNPHQTTLALAHSTAATTRQRLTRTP